MSKNVVVRTLVTAIAIFVLMAAVAPQVGAQSAGPDFQVSFNPSGGQSVGGSVNIHIKVNSSNPGATRISVSCGGVSKGETSEVEFDSNWNTSGCNAGTQQITIQARNPDDPNWSNPNTKTFGYDLTGGQPPPPPPPPPGPSQGPSLSTFAFNPGSATVGDNVDIHIVVNSSNPGATKLTVSCGSLDKNETSEVEFHSTWYTSGCNAGTQQVTVLSRSVDDPNWQSATTTSSPYTLNAPPNPVPVPSASFSVDSTNIQAGQCTYLHWSTSGADSVDIDGTNVAASGDKQVCPSVTTKYTLTARNSTGPASRNLTVVVSSQQASPSVASSFQTGDIINIGGNIYVIVSGQRRHVPNPDTLDALGIPRSWINNRGYSDSDLNTIPQGPDIPDVNRDTSGFQSFKNWIFPNLSPIVPPVATPVPNQAPQTGSISLTVSPSSVAPGGNVTVQWSGYNPDGNDWISLHRAGRPDSEYFAWQYARGSSGSLTFTAPQEPGLYNFRLYRNGTKVATSNSFNVVAGSTVPVQPTPTVPAQTSSSGGVIACQPEPLSGIEVGAAAAPCTNHVYDKTPTIRICWKGSFPDGAGWDNWARDSGGRSKGCGFSVTDMSDIRIGDIAVWERNCYGANADHGHVAIVTGNKAADGTIQVDEANWNRDHTKVPVYSCMSFIHLQSGSTQSTGNTGSNAPGNIFQQIGDFFTYWWHIIFGP